MKYISILFLSFLAFASCSSDDSDALSSQNEKNILGTWFYDREENNIQGEITHYEYTNRLSKSFNDRGIVFDKWHFDSYKPHYRIDSYCNYQIKKDSIFYVYESGSQSNVKIEKLTSSEFIYSFKLEETQWRKEGISTVFLKR